MINQLCFLLVSIFSSLSPFKLNLFSKNGLRIDYTVRLDRFSLSRGNEWISLSPSVLAILVTVARCKSESEIIKIQQNGSFIEIIKLLDNFIVSFTNKNLTSSLVLESDVVKCLEQSYENILERVSNHKKVRQPVQRLKHKNVEPGE